MYDYNIDLPESATLSTNREHYTIQNMNSLRSNLDDFVTSTFTFVGIYAGEIQLCSRFVVPFFCESRDLGAEGRFKQVECRYCHGWRNRIGGVTPFLLPRR
jgi:hypothetical protein